MQSKRPKTNLQGTRIYHEGLFLVVAYESGQSGRPEHCMKSTVACETVDYDMMP